MNYTLFSLLLFFMLFGTPSITFANSQYQAIDIGGLWPSGKVATEITAINDAGQVVGYSYISG